MLHTLAVSNFRSLRELVIPLGRLTVVTGANGVGKSSLYRCLRLLGDAANGQLVRSLAHQGGLPSTLWAGPERISRGMRDGHAPIQGTRRTGPVKLRLGFGSEDFGYSLELGPPHPSANAFALDPEIKREVIWAGSQLNRGSILVDRNRNLVRIANDTGDWHAADREVPMFESLLTRVSDPGRAPEVLLLRDRIRAWRFYDHLRADPGSPARSPQVPTWTPALSHDGSDLVAALMTLQATEQAEAFDEVVEDAFPGCSVGVSGHERGTVAMHQPGLLRPLVAAELSEGTLRFIMLATALLGPYPPPLLVLNEPESSLHTDLLPALGRLICRASERTQVWVVTHSTILARQLEEAPDAVLHVLTKDTGETRVHGQDLLTTPDWAWPKR